MQLTKEEKDWWQTIDKDDAYLSKIWFSMFGSTEQRIKQFYIIRNIHNFKLND